MNIQDQLRASSVSRWHIVATKKPQSLAEHQFNVAIIAQEIAIKIGVNGWDINGIVSNALQHDMHEVMDGDAPSPSKPPKPFPTTAAHMVVKMADLIEAHTFIFMNYVDRHGQQVSQDCEKRMLSAIGEFDDLDRPIIRGIVNQILQGEHKI